jgi:hypothetical protein
VLVRIDLYNLICINVLTRLEPNTRHLGLQILFHEINGYVGVEGYDSFNEREMINIQPHYNFGTTPTHNEVGPRVWAPPHCE